MIFDFLLKRLRRAVPQETPAADEDANVDPLNPFPDPVVIPFRDVLDLHSIPPKQVRAVVEDYLNDAHARGCRGVRIIHGKGVGVQREIVRSLLARTPFVIHFADATAEAGGWGATVVTLRSEQR
ncbi:MAG TPA: Smr/MutS family protein [Blastocatellia bacterium]|nr:Smr/MutS family protein [Blastocatellia bacterium]